MHQIRETAKQFYFSISYTKTFSNFISLSFQFVIHMCVSNCVHFLRDYYVVWKPVSVATNILIVLDHDLRENVCKFLS